MPRVRFAALVLFACAGLAGCSEPGGAAEAVAPCVSSSGPIYETVLELARTAEVVMTGTALGVRSHETGRGYPAVYYDFKVDRVLAGDAAEPGDLVSLYTQVQGPDCPDRPAPIEEGQELVVFAEEVLATEVVGMERVDRAFVPLMSENGIFDIRSNGLGVPRDDEWPKALRGGSGPDAERAWSLQEIAQLAPRRS